MMIRRMLFIITLIAFVSTSCFAAQRRTPVVDAVSKAREAVVNIRTEKLVQRRNSRFFGFGDSIFEQYFRDLLPAQSYKTQSLGSGVIIDAEGHILTNAHVVDKASKIFIALSDDQPELEAQLIGKDNRIDLAILKIVEAGDYPFLPLGRSDDLLLGETIIAIGNPLGLGHSITTGIISSLQRRIQIDQQHSAVFIQSDALINPGNSGGPLININGELIGINTAMATQAQGIGFAIPINTAKRVLSDLINHGRVRPGFMGLLVGAVSPTYVKSHGTGGVLIEEIQAGSPAQKAGLLEADVILKIDGVAVAFPEQYFSLRQTYTPGDRLKISLLRGAKRLTKIVELESLPLGYELSYTRRVFGFDLYQRRDGVYINKVIAGSVADKVGLQRGDQIIKVDNVRVANLTEYKQVIEYRLGRRPLTFTVVRGNVGYRVELP
ncbi:serine protease, S1-C subfamily, contains C-terminal PDZ domain [Desulfuromusa kysingii]|uniref:Serine protease, S1-C subfamily, contains C-terminal PDZ domain n=1 Tax=Desulfuromusa kysingii TaxID=37625 RepID=A0A1H4C2N2_9BACT|nr:trypsin-like peptidase domain-containing protein [Desulfuromusa kysingii]SEA54590.1 serine protease, S1-C subfamily, contains C-terminal PDZ domain [Desulfuromusa kysingii]